MARLSSSTVTSVALAGTLLLAGCAEQTPTESVSAIAGQQSLSAPVAAKSADAVVNSIGLNTHLGYFQTAYGTGFNTIIKPRLTALGVRHLRDNGTVVADNKWMSTVYGRMAELSRAGMRFALVLNPGASGNYSAVQDWDRLLSYAAPVL
ncbi:MAG TPA: hypothetical protein VG817_03615, partial [Gemmatimonadales bacterium]|nr:hypothetical protein [Gemmatimonadales bacterium]